MVIKTEIGNLLYPTPLINNVMNVRLFHFLLFVLIIFFKISLLFSQSTKYWPKREFPHIIAEDKLWIGTPKGLYQYHFDEDSWAVFGEHSGLPDNNIEILQWDEEYLWIVTPGGIAYGDVKLNKWISYNATNGLPSNTVYSIAFQEDYVWIGTDRGAARFDKLIQEWEIFTMEDGLPDSVIYDIVIDGDLVYFGTAKGLAEYDVNFEKWRYYGMQEDAASDTVRFIYQTTDYLWLFTDRGPNRFSKSLHSSLIFKDNPGLQYSRIRDLVVYNEQFWLASDEGVLIYDPGNNIWRNFQEEVNLPSLIVNALNISQDRSWFITEKGVAVLDNKTKTWQIYDKTHGLTSQQYDEVAIFRGRSFLINFHTIDYYKSIENRWYNYPLKDISGISQKKTPYVSIDKEKGSYVQVNPQVRFSLNGTRFTTRYQRQHEYYNISGHQLGPEETIHRSDLKGQLSFLDERTINGFYNNTDYSQVLYGVRYKGKKGDIAQELNWGDVWYEQGKNKIMSSIGVFGVSARLEAGPKTERYKRSIVSAKAWSGEKTTGSETEFFTGNLKRGSASIRDVDYVRNTYFKLETTEESFTIEDGSEQIYIDDGDSKTNTENTLKNYIVGGVSGDFDIMHSYLDYIIDYRRNKIKFLKSINDKSTIVIKGVAHGRSFEQIIKRPGIINNSLVNHYFTGGIEIVPSSFILKIFDSLGNPHSLSEFDLDFDNNGKVDPEWIDYKEGIISFPKEKPFPSSVYESSNPVSCYYFQVEFQTEVTFITLKQDSLIRGSEVVIIDGEILSPGQDYVLDYTSGTLLIIKEGIVAEDSEIEVDYKYYRNSREKFNLTGFGFAPSDNILVEADYFAFDDEKSDLSTEQFKGYHVFSEFKWKVKEIDFKVTPEFARNSNSFQNGNSLYLRTDMSSQKFRLYSIYEKYDPGFKHLFPKKFQLGNLNEQIAAGGTYYPFEFLDFNANWKRKSTSPKDNGKKNKEEDISGKILFSRKLYPVISLSARHRTLDSKNLSSIKETLKADFEYQIPRNLLQKISLKSVRVYGVWRRSWEDKGDSQYSIYISERNKIYDTQYLRFDISPIDLVQVNSYYRSSSIKAKDISTSRISLLNKQQKLFIDLTLDRITGINMNVRYQGENQESFSSTGSRFQNVSLYRSLQSNTRIFPGKWIRFMAPFSFEFNYVPTWKGYLRNVNQKLSLTEKFWRFSARDELISSENNKLYQFRGEWRPSPLILLYAGFDFHENSSSYLSSQLKTNIRRFHHKVEYRPTIHSLITVQYFYNYEAKLKYSSKILNNPLIWFENRWSEKLQTKLNISYRREERQTGKIREYFSTLSPLLGFTYRFRKSDPSTSRAEIRNDLSFSFYRSNSMNNNSVSNAFAIDYYPVSVLILRFRLVTTFQNKIYSNQQNVNNLLELRLTAQF